jgi:hypothetical protein
MSASDSSDELKEMIRLAVGKRSVVESNREEMGCRTSEAIGKARGWSGDRRVE